ncbi:MAG TPA: hypothetical protein VGM15_00740, partial [Burkholderiaceae bacterium]
PPAAPSPQQIAMASPVIRSGARWFWWIAGLSLVNIVLFQTKSNTSFVVGLGITAISDAVFSQDKAVGFVIDALAVGFFLLMGAQAARGMLWAFYVGLAVYALDALIYLNYQDWMPVAFHALAIFFIAKGAMALRAALRPAA